ncbi:SpoIID/LytB domain-containing protein [Brevibacillus dissolubilis]|uniref:SpoIID/LytB domain-containing protein n=1 Tax=Brevibacillus dissolubilis TaxID=1844116 RepID=UPI00159BEFA5|nr:SpoIID/LytB domain-containing protein [Brevibacillus dissolubilis]
MKKINRIIPITTLLFSMMFGSGAGAVGTDKTDSVERAYVAAVTDEGAFQTYQLITDGQLQTFKTANKSVDVHAGDFVNAKVHDDMIVKFEEKLIVPSSQEKIMAKDTAKKQLDLEKKGWVSLNQPYAVYQVKGDQVTAKSLQDVYVGAENIKTYYTADGKVDLVVLDGPTPTKTMRIGIMNQGFASLDHTKFDVKSAGGLQLTDKKADKTINVEPNTLLSITPAAGQLKVTVNGTEAYTTANRLYVLPAQADSLVQVMSYTRAYGNPLYRGFFEVTPAAAAGKLNVINEVLLENYLYQVVPSEMPASFGIEALKAQSVAARTYALSDYYSNRYATKGFHVDDSTLSQVYNNSAENALTTQAVNETKGIIMEHNGDLVDARYYSTSGGFGAAKHEVWADANGAFPGTPVAYLQGQPYTYDPADNSKMVQIDTTNEEQLNAFYKNVSYTGYDSDSFYFRWKVTFSKQELENSINTNIAGRYTADPKFVLTLDSNGQFVSKPIPAAGIGTLKNLYVSKRGQGGNMMELVIESSTGTYKIVKEYNIRFTIRPSKSFTLGNDVLLYRAKGASTTYDATATMKNYTILPSSFATFDIVKDANDAITSVTFYGGGNGHGAGMSQYGASSLGAKGWKVEQILRAYYPNAELVNVYEKETSYKAIAQ